MRINTTAALFITVLSTVTPVLASIINVPADQPTIQAAIIAAVDGDQIVVAPGTYVEAINFNSKALSLVSRDGAAVTVLSPPHLAQSTVIIENTMGRYTEFAGFTVTGGGPARTIIVNHSSPSIHDNVFHNNIPIGSQNIEVISCSNSAAFIENNIFYENGGIGCIGLRGVDQGSYIIDNTFYANERGFFSIANGGTALNNIVVNSIERGIGATQASSFSKLDYNLVYNNNPNYDVASIEGPNDIHADPLLVDPGNANFNLSSGSPCIDGGHPDAAYNDADGSRNDIGAGTGFTTSFFPVADNFMVTPINSSNRVTSRTPEFSWTFLDPSGATQQKYEIQIGTDAFWSVAETWESGEVVSSVQAVTYAGPTLADFSTYYLRIRVFNGTVWGRWVMTSFVVVTTTIVHVPSDRPTIQSAINIAFDGIRIVVAPGQYAEKIDFLEKDISLVSSHGAAHTKIVAPNSIGRIITVTNVNSDFLEFAGFTVSGAGSDHTFVVDRATPNIHDNIFHDNIPEGTADREVISLSKSAATITRNLFYNNGGIGCVGLRGGSGGTRIINNTFDGNQRGFFSIANGAVALNNIVTNSRARGIGAVSPTNFLHLDYNVLYNNNPDYDVASIEGPNDIHANPMYVDPENHNYSLLPGSPCINAGHPDAMYNDEDGSRNDIGAFPMTSCCIGIRGDVNSDGAIDISDMVALVDYIYGGGPEPACIEEADVNGSNSERDPDIVDIVFIVDYFFGGGAEPAECM